MTTRPTTRAAAHPGMPALAILVLVAAVLEVAAPVVTTTALGESPGSGSGPELLITPIGWAFSIWGVIYTLAIAQAVSTVVRGAESVPRRLQLDLLVLYLGGALWIAMAATGSSLATALALLLMLVAALDAVLTTARSTFQPGWFSGLTRAAVSLYAGWVTAAFFLNVSTALVGLNVVQADDVGWQLVVLAVAALTLLAVLVRIDGIVGYAAAGVWAMLGIAVRGQVDSSPSVLVAAAVVGAAIVVVTIGLALRRR